MLRELMLVAAAAVIPSPTAPQREIAAAMDRSAAGWNAGALDRFVAIYADDAVYVGRDGLTSGKAAIAARYAKSFNVGGNERGRLSFQTLGWRHISATHELMYARWMLSRSDGSGEQGMTTLLFERRAQGWRIISDHSS